MSVESGYLVFCSSRGDGALIHLNACVLTSIAWFYFFAQSGFRFGVFFLYFLARCHSVMAAFNLLVFQSHRTSHLVHAA